MESKYTKAHKGQPRIAKADQGRPRHTKAAYWNHKFSLDAKAGKGRPRRAKTVYNGIEIHKSKQMHAKANQGTQR